MKTVKLLAKKLLLCPSIARLVLPHLLTLHTWSEQWASMYAGVLSTDHPKHKIIGYSQWFFNQIMHGWNIVDIGSNTGYIARYLSKKAQHVYGIEFDAKLYDEAVRSTTEKNVSFIFGDATQINYDILAPIDCVILSNVLEHIDDRINFLQYLEEEIPWNSCCQLFLFRVPMLDRDWLVLYKQQLGIDYRLDKTHFIEYTKESFALEMKKAGLCIESLNIHMGEIYAICRAGAV